MLSFCRWMCGTLCVLFKCNFLSKSENILSRNARSVSTDFGFDWLINNHSWLRINVYCDLFELVVVYTILIQGFNSFFFDSIYSSLDIDVCVYICECECVCVSFLVYLIWIICIEIGIIYLEIYIDIFKLTNGQWSMIHVAELHAWLWWSNIFISIWLWLYLCAGWFSWFSV